MKVNHVNHMSPDTSPDTITKKTGVRRANNVPLYLICGAFLVITSIHFYNVRSKSSNKPHSEEIAQAAHTGTTKKYAESIVGDWKHGEIPPIKEVADLQEPKEQPKPVENLAPPSKSNNEQLQQLASNEELERIRAIKMQQLDAAVKAKTKVPVEMPLISATSVNQKDADISARNRSNDPTAAYQARLAELQGSNIQSESGAPQLLVASNTTQGSSNIATFQQFGGNGAENDRWRLDSKPAAPRTPYELRAGFILPATLISGINSELPGQIMGQVSQNVYDTPTGKHLLIPQGSRLVGTYSSEVAYGQSRVLVAWQRIVFPDGKAMDIGEMPGTDVAGYSGFKDKVNNHYLRIFGSAIMMSAISASYAYSQDVIAV